MYLAKVDIFVWLFFVVFSNPAYGQLVKVVPIEQNEDSYSFPHLLGDSVKHRVCEKINTYLQVHYLSQVPGTYLNDDPYYRAKNNFNCGQKIFQDFEASYLNPKVLEVVLYVEQSYCTGMGLDWFTSIDYFDVIDGEKIELADLFSVYGLRSLKMEAVHEMRSQLQGYIKEIRDEVRAMKSEPNEQDIQFLLDQSDLYQSCLKYTDTSEFQYYQYKITSDSITFKRNKCYWNETGRSLDEKSVPQVKFSLENLAPLLSSFGKELLLESGQTSTNPSLKNKLFKGYIGGKYPVKAIVKESGERLEIVYWYEKVKQTLLWEGEYNNDNYLLKERVYYDDDSEPIADVTINFIRSNGRWTANGTWKDLSDGRVLSIDLKEY